jgi:enamine deaminase RidA (YjgF/YER057c/UK114 family)
MPRTRVDVADVAEAGPGLWTNGIRAGDFLYISGQVARPFEGGTGLIGTTEYEQAKQIFARIRKICEAAGGSMADVVKVTIFLVDITKNTEVWKARREPGAQFLLAWLIPSWLVFEAVISKLPHYVLPLYPAIAILIAGILEGGGLSKTRWLVWGTVGWFLFPSLIAIAVVAVFLYIDHDLGLIAWPSAAAAVVIGLFAWRLYEVDGPERSLLRGMVTSVLIAITVYAITFPALPALFPSALIADDLRAAGCEEPQVAATGYYQEPSLVFLLGTKTLFTSGAGAAEFLQRGPCHFALIDARSEGSFIQRANAIGLRYALAERMAGYNVSIGRPVALAVFRSMAKP